MNKLLLALQGFEDLGPLHEQDMTEEKSDRVEMWLKEDVCPAVEALIDNRSFQIHTLWSVSHLRKGMGTAERQLVERVDNLLVKLAEQIKTCLPYLDQPTLTEFQLESIELIAEKNWFDLVNPDDFVLPTQHLMLDRSDEQHTFHFRKASQIKIPGDHVCDSMFARIEYWKKILDQVCRICFCAKRTEDEQSNREFSSLMYCVGQLDPSIEDLKKACLKTKQKILRDACVTLSLVYLAYADHPEVNWLIRDSRQAKVITQSFRRSVVRPPGELQHVEKQPNGSFIVIKKERALLCVPSVIRKIAKALADVKTIYDSPDDPDDLIDWACSHARLVLVDHFPRQVFWEGKSIDAKWDTEEIQWNLLWTLAKNPEKAVDREMLYQPQGQKINSRRHRLKKLLVDCSELNELITTVPTHGYRLELNSEGIILLESDGLGGLNRVPIRKASSNFL
ncbi:helix-turn-helix domain-containing protein [Gimesia panareensis]|uniref:helix-turn-helix domain-containing protein n=1 Tax=Gimesia panareensis TaxID=2527978 RepID=UPI0011AB0302|nr:helix-turn-helix domain-containing protein [Gimesia panareensis]